MGGHSLCSVRRRLWSLSRRRRGTTQRCWRRTTRSYFTECTSTMFSRICALDNRSRPGDLIRSRHGFPITPDDLLQITDFALSNSKALDDEEALAIVLKSSWVETTGLTDPVHHRRGNDPHIRYYRSQEMGPEWNQASAACTDRVARRWEHEEPS